MVNATPKGMAEYVYNGFRKRVKKVENLHNPAAVVHNPTNNLDPTSELNYILDLTLPYDNLLMTEGTHNQSFIWGNELIGTVGDESYNYLQDHLGSPIRLMGKDTDNIFAYDVFGKELLADTANPFGFTGYQADGITDLYYAQARYYNPNIGRFNAEDIIKAGNNWYDYCSGNPLGFIDPLGLDRFPNIDIDAWRSQSQMANREPRQQQSFADWYDSLPNWGQNLVIVTGTVAVVGITAITGGKAIPVIKPILISIPTYKYAGLAGGAIIGAGYTFLEDQMLGRDPRWETYFANIVTSAAAGAFLIIPHGKIALTRIIAIGYGQATSAEILDQGLQMITGRREYFSSIDLIIALFISGTINTVAIYTAGILAPRGRGTTPKYFKRWMEGKIGRNLIWRQERISSGINLIGEWVINVLESIKNLIGEMFNRDFIKPVDCDK